MWTRGLAIMFTQVLPSRLFGRVKVETDRTVPAFAFRRE